MKSFLEHVAKDIIKKFGTDLSRTALVFPNKRAALFINEHLAREAGRPLWSPAYITIDDLFKRHSEFISCDQLKLICDLHKCFIKCTGTNETLDHFFGWGQLMLSDFDDIDKNMADADKVFANISDIHELDDISYLTEEQIEAINLFFSNFSKEHNSKLKQRFLSLWSHFADIYHEFNNILSEQGLAYDGALYRKVAESEEIHFQYDRYIFVGFNLLQKVEQKMFDRLKKEKPTHFYWDFDKYYMPKGGTHSIQHEAGHYIAQYLEYYPNELDIKDSDIYDNLSKEKQIRFIASGTEDMQARYAYKWLRDNDRYRKGRSTAIVMCNEQLLPTLIHCLPEETDKVNITTGYPLSQSPVSSLLKVLLELNTIGYNANTDKYRLKHVNAVLRHPYMRYISPKGNSMYKKLNIDTKIYYPSPEKDLTDNDDVGITELFNGLNVQQITTEDMPEQTLKWIMRLLKIIAANSKDDTKDPLFQESLFRTYTMLNRLISLCEKNEKGERDLEINIVTMQRLITQLTDATSIPFHGEPAEGLQIMGMLETRNLDFKHLLVLSCNEGQMPKGVNNSSFIPYSIRKAYNLTTIDHKVAIYAYYFYRLLQRAEDITIVYNSTADERNTGEMSRFMLQLQVESNHKIEKYSLKAGVDTATRVIKSIEKTQEVMRCLINRFDLKQYPNRDPRKTQINSFCSDKLQITPLLTPSAINKYQRCPLQFFYTYLGGLYENENDEEDSMDNRIFGNIFHVASENIYKLLMQKSNNITKNDIDTLLKNKVEIVKAVDNAFREELFKIKDNNSFCPEYNGLQIINREVIITFIHRLLNIDKQLTPFKIIGLENVALDIIKIKAGDTDIETTIGGRIDRIDWINDGSGEHLRIVDYKTGSKKPKGMKSIDDVFNPDNIGGDKHADNYLQAMLYSIIVNKNYNPRNLPVSPALLFIQHASDNNYNPVLTFGNEAINDIDKYENEYMDKMSQLLNEIFNPDIPFRKTSDSKRCETCPYKDICGG